MSENQHGLLDWVSCLHRLHNLLHYLRIVCVTISVDSFLASHWSDQSDRAPLLARGSEVQTSTHAPNNNRIINPTLTLEWGKKCIHHLPGTWEEWRYMMKTSTTSYISDCFQFWFCRPQRRGYHTLLPLWVVLGHWGLRREPAWTGQSRVATLGIITNQLLHCHACPDTNWEYAENTADMYGGFYGLSGYFLHCDNI